MPDRVWHRFTTEAVDVMAAEFSGDACEKFALDLDWWKDQVMKHITVLLFTITLSGRKKADWLAL